VPSQLWYANHADIAVALTACWFSDKYFASCCNKYYGTNFISAVPTSLLIAPGLRTIKFLFSLQAMMDRERKDELPQMQVGFIDVVCRPLYTTLSESFPWIKPLLDGCLANREKWADLAEKVSNNWGNLGVLAAHRVCKATGGRQMSL
jgi:hypothetical protein